MMTPQANQMFTTHPKPASEGTLVLSLVLGPPWPLGKDAIVHSMRLVDGIVSVFFVADGSIGFEAKSDAGHTIAKGRSCALEVESECDVAIAIGWDDKGWSIVVNGTIVGGEGMEMATPLKVAGRHQHPIRDLSSMNDRAFDRRRDVLAGSKPLPERVRTGEDAVIHALKTEVLQLRDLTAALRDRKHYMIPAIASRLRMLIVTGRPLPLLQMYAALRGLPLIVYTYPEQGTVNDFTANVEAGGIGISFSLSSTPSYGMINPLDLDVWLDLPGGSHDGRQLSNRDILKQIGDTIGSHFEKDMKPVVAGLRAMSTGMKGWEADHLANLIDQVATAILDLAEDTLAAGGDALS